MRYILLLLTLVHTSVFAQDLITAKMDTVLMGSRFVFTAVHESEAIAWKGINQSLKEVIRIESLISSWDKNSETSKVNLAAGIKPVKVSEELYQLISRCKKISELTNGYFDISFASLDKIWDFDKSYSELPSSDLIESSVQNIDYQNIILDKDDRTVFLKKKGMKIGFGAIGKGYAANRAKLIMTDLNIKNGVVNAGGDLTSWGTKPGGELWTVGIIDPFNKEKVKLWLNVTNIAVVTSGDYEKFVMIDSKRYSHIINPKTGWPAQGVKSVSIICPDAELADALATTLFCIGRKSGIALINELDGIECLVIDDTNKIFYSNKLEMNYLVKK
jgi:thiamine biosynthesis lipoprotein